MRRSKYEAEIMLEAVQEYLEGRSSQQAIADRLQVDRSSLRQWINKYESMGADAFIESGNKRYPKEVKEQAVADYLAGRGSLIIREKQELRG